MPLEIHCPQFLHNGNMDNAKIDNNPCNNEHSSAPMLCPSDFLTKIISDYRKENNSINVRDKVLLNK